MSVTPRTISQKPCSMRSRGSQSDAWKTHSSCETSTACNTTHTIPKSLQDCASKATSRHYFADVKRHLTRMCLAPCSSCCSVAALNCNQFRDRAEQQTARTASVFRGQWLPGRELTFPATCIVGGTVLAGRQHLSATGSHPTTKKRSRSYTHSSDATSLAMAGPSQGASNNSGLGLKTIHTYSMDSHMADLKPHRRS